MSDLCQRMIRELELHRKSVKMVEELRDFLHHLIVERKLANGSVNQKLAGIRFFWRQVPGRREFDLRVPAKRS